ncbi:GTP-binding protein [Paenibacillus beijingensis]|uniref:CobW/HypB/UreG nucleotide-binding domain-containing protein n=1 Tax=Paenibacillus beijingensis TaxID=1126833 RepID=A0A0D5NR25_9BACL|nr:GTP-binding protein [Paenibacillus beijingensis]AJY77368.1 hypothetical protein VN24_25940 [Paenibacillus beijingensis]
MKTNVALIGGFLGAGKTSLISELALALERSGEKVVVITNDQGDHLIDSEMMEASGIATSEITGGCFCCRFEDLHDTMKQAVEQYHPTWILAEAVGSCTDLVATVYRPLQRLSGNQFRLSPVTIVVDPERADLVLEEGRTPFPWEIGYLFSQQIQEADIILLNKCEIVEAAVMDTVQNKMQSLNPTARMLKTSAMTRSGLEGWLEMLQKTDEPSGQSLLSELDYETYGTAEAKLAWLNCKLNLSRVASFDLQWFMTEYASLLSSRFTEHSFEAAHVKLMGFSGNMFVKGSLTASGRDWQWTSSNLQEVLGATVLVNARICADTKELADMVIQCAKEVSNQLALRCELVELQSFNPSPPVPTYRDN